MNTKRRGSTKGTRICDASEVEPWGKPVTGSALLDELAQTVLRYVVLPAACPENLALWILHTYAFELRDVHGHDWASA